MDREFAEISVWIGERSGEDSLEKRRSDPLAD
jgi:hypothetical protein